VPKAKTVDPFDLTTSSIAKFLFRYTARKMKDGQRTERAFGEAAGKPLRERDALGAAGSPPAR
jgi:hypothetical protein